MADEQTTPAAPSASAPSSSPSGSPPPSPAASPSAITPSAPIQNSSAPETTTEPAKRPAYVPEAHWDVATGKVKDDGALAKFVNDHVAFKAAEDSRRLTLPQKPEDYKLELSKGFKLPQGVEFVPNDNDPILPQARAFAQKHGLTQEGFSELVDLHAAGQIGSQELIKNAKAAELAKLGAAATQRVDVVSTYLKARIGDDLAKEMMTYQFTAKQIEGFEKLMANDRTQGAGSFDPRFSETAQPGKVSDEQYRAMSPGERHEYAKKFPQPHMNGGR